MRILGIETSCDETAAAVVENGRKVLSSVVASQIKIHQPYSGVVPEIASRHHVLLVNQVVALALKKAQVSLRKGARRRIDKIGVTVGPGLAGALLVGKMTAEGLGWSHKVPVVGVNHLEGHLLSPLVGRSPIKHSFLGLVVSGGHTELILGQKNGRYERIGQTRDDAAGEAFDKVAKMMGLGYPGGPVVDRYAKEGNASKFPFPEPWLPGTWDFSFSGLKTAMLYKLREKKKWSKAEKKNLCAGFQASVVRVLVGKTLAAAQAFKTKTIVVGGGVACNSQLRSELTHEAKKRKLELCIASPHLCTDNAAMIAVSAAYKSKKVEFKVQPQLNLPRISKKHPDFSMSFLRP